MMLEYEEYKDQFVPFLATIEYGNVTDIHYEKLGAQRQWLRGTQYFSLFSSADGLGKKDTSLKSYHSRSRTA